MKSTSYRGLIAKGMLLVSLAVASVVCLCSCGSQAIQDPKAFLSDYLSETGAVLVEKSSFDDAYFAVTDPGESADNVYLVATTENDKGWGYTLYHPEQSSLVYDFIIDFGELEGFESIAMYYCGDNAQKILDAFSPNNYYGSFHYNSSTRDLIYTSASSSKGYSSYDFIVLPNSDDPRG